MKTVTVEVQPDHLQTLSRVKRPLAAVTELMWNGLDADADEIRVEFHKNELDGITRVIVHDDGHGLQYDEAEAAFQKLGGSWKKTAQKTQTKGRILHGQLGRGRFKAFAIGTSVVWSTVYRTNGTGSQYEITGSSSNIGTFTISDPHPVPTSDTGTSVDVALSKNFVSLVGENAQREIAEEFALYLLQYPNVKLYYDGLRVDPTSLFRAVEEYDLGKISLPSGEATSAKLAVIEWNHGTDRALFLCDESGVALHRVNVGSVVVRSLI